MSESPFDAFREILESDPNVDASKFDELMGLFSQVQQQRNTKSESETDSSADDDCAKGVDCSELTSPCCGLSLKTIRGTLPIEVYCVECQRPYKLGHLMHALTKK